MVIGLGVRGPVTEIALTDALELERRLTGGALDADGVGGEVEQHLGRERVVARMERCQQGRDLVDLVVVCETGQRDLDHLVPIIIGWR